MAHEDTDSDAAASLLAMHAMVSWLARREVEREPGARRALEVHVEAAMSAIVRRDPRLLRTAQEACGLVARAMGEAPTLRVVQ